MAKFINVNGKILKFVIYLLKNREEKLNRYEKMIN